MSDGSDCFGTIVNVDTAEFTGMIAVALGNMLNIILKRCESKYE